MTLRPPSLHIVILNWKDKQHDAAGGAELYCHEIAAEFQARGHRVTMVVGRSPGQRKHDVVEGVKVRRLGGTYDVYPKVLAWLLKHRDRIDAVIDSQNGIPFFSPISLRAGTPVTLLIHHVHQEQFGQYFPGWAATVGRFLEARGSRWIYGRRPVAVVSPSSRTEVRRQLALKGPVYLAPNGHRDPYPPQNISRTMAPTITVVGRLVAHKRVDILLRAVAEVRRDEPELRVNVVGTGPERDALERLSCSLGLSEAVVFHGFVSDQQRDELLAGAWLTVQSSRGEGWGLSVIEAAGFGVPTVALDVPGLRDSVRDGITGWLSDEPRLPETIRKALQSLADEKTAHVWAEECRSWAARFRWSTTAERLWTVLEQEALRQRLPHDYRQARSDACTVVTLGAELARRLQMSTLRRTDQSTFCRLCPEEPDAGRRYRLLLTGADEVDAASVLVRCGLNPLDPDVQVRLARPSDLLVWSDCEPVHHPRMSPSQHRDETEGTLGPTARASAEVSLR